MTPPHIIGKLELLLHEGITTEPQVVYLLAGVRKLLEQNPPKPEDLAQFDYLKLHCDWALHSRLDGRMAQRILRLFEVANLELRAGGELENLPSHQRQEIEFISKMTYFERELTHFLEMNNLPDLNEKRSDGFAHFLHLYTKVIEECPLVMTSRNPSATVDSVTIRVDFAKGRFGQRDEMFYKVNWIVSDRNGKSGNIFVINSFSLNPNADVVAENPEVI